MRKFGRLAGIAVVVGVSLVAAPASADYANWGQEVKDCNLSDCYPGGGSRGSYVSGQASDGEGPGYAYEIHTLANPGSADPTLP